MAVWPANSRSRTWSRRSMARSATLIFDRGSMGGKRAVMGYEIVLDVDGWQSVV